MLDFGHFALGTAWLLAIFAIVVGTIGGLLKKPGIFRSIRTATSLQFFFLLASFLCLAYGFLTNDYRSQYIWQHSNEGMAPIYKIAAIWGGMDGSMLLWALMLAVSMYVFQKSLSKTHSWSSYWALITLSTSSFFFISVTFLFTNPFRYLASDFIPPDGNGLNPLLQNAFMAIHPPMLYAGFTTFTIPYAYCLGALIAGDMSNDWIKAIRRWTLIAWCFLTCGIVLGGHWAYIELGWGGFWAWDPVENASFLPWLTGTAFLHSIMVQERKNMLKIWNIWLIVLTYALTVFGTFLTRSGVVQSVHAFASTDIGWVFLLYLAIIFMFALSLTFLRRKELVSARGIESLLSRETAFLLNNLVLLSICFATIWGVMFPIISEAVTGHKQTVGIPFFNAVNVPLFLLLLFLMGAGPLLAWRKTSLGQLKSMFGAPFLLGLVASIVVVWAGVSGFYPVLSYGLVIFISTAIFQEFYRGYRHMNKAEAPHKRLSSLVTKHRARYGGYVIHLGVVVAAIGITASMAHKTETEFSLKTGEFKQAGRYHLELKELDTGSNDNFQWLKAKMEVSQSVDNRFLGDMFPEKRIYLKRNEPTTEVALRMSLKDDLYIVLAGLNDSGDRAVFKVYINPLQVWLWFGSILMIIGGIIILWPTREIKNLLRKFESFLGVSE